jgi:hypothetical protein
VRTVMLLVLELLDFVQGRLRKAFFRLVMTRNCLEPCGPMTGALKDCNVMQGCHPGLSCRAVMQGCHAGLSSRTVMQGCLLFEWHHTWSTPSVSLGNVGER